MNFRSSSHAHQLSKFVLLSGLLLLGCSHQAVRPELESRKFAQEIGLPGCEVSVPLSRNEVLEFAGRLGAPDLASSSEWAEAISLIEPSDQFRRVFCPKTNDNFFGIFRGGSVLFKFGGFIYD